MHQTLFLQISSPWHGLTLSKQDSWWRLISMWTLDLKTKTNQHPEWNPLFERGQLDDSLKRGKAAAQSDSLKERIWSVCQLWALCRLEHGQWCYRAIYVVCSLRWCELAQVATLTTMIWFWLHLPTVRARTHLRHFKVIRSLHCSQYISWRSDYWWVIGDHKWQDLSPGRIPDEFVLLTTFSQENIWKGNDAMTKFPSSTNWFLQEASNPSGLCTDYRAICLLIFVVAGVNNPPTCFPRHHCHSQHISHCRIWAPLAGPDI